MISDAHPLNAHLRKKAQMGVEWSAGRIWAFSGAHGQVTRREMTGLFRHGMENV